MATIRLNRFLAQCGIASRRRSDALIEQGEVRVNGDIIYELGHTIDSEKDAIVFQGKPVKPQIERFVMLNKPIGYVVSASDPEGRQTVFELLKDIPERLFPIGRLDLNSKGLLLLTNMGKLAHRLAHPRFNVRKTYHAIFDGHVNGENIERLKTGVELDDGPTAPAKVRVLKTRKDSTLLEIKIHEGRNRQIRRMAEAVGHKVLDLERVAVDHLQLGRLQRGCWRYLTANEIDDLKRRVNYENDEAE